MAVISRILETLSGFNALSIAFRILLSALIGGCIGFQRERHGRVAGLRTHILVCLGSTMTAMVGLYPALVLGFNSDPMRVSAQVISGIGFLGAGTILTRNQSHVTGLTTAAGLWTTASIGLAIGIGFYWAALAAFLVVMITISILTNLEKMTKSQDAYTYYVELNDISAVNPFTDEMADVISDLQIIQPRSGTADHIGVAFNASAAKNSSAALLEKIRSFDHVVIAVASNH